MIGCLLRGIGFGEFWRRFFQRFKGTEQAADGQARALFDALQAELVIVGFNSVHDDRIARQRCGYAAGTPTIW